MRSDLSHLNFQNLDLIYLKYFYRLKQNKIGFSIHIFDLIVIDALYNDCALALAHKLNAKTIMFDPTSVFSWWYDLFGFPSESSWISEIHVPFPYPMTFDEYIIII